MPCLYCQIPTCHVRPKMPCQLRNLGAIGDACPFKAKTGTSVRMSSISVACSVVHSQAVNCQKKVGWVTSGPWSARASPFGSACSKWWPLIGQSFRHAMSIFMPCYLNMPCQGQTCHVNRPQLPLRYARQPICMALNVYGTTLRPESRNCLSTTPPRIGSAKQLAGGIKSSG